MMEFDPTFELTRKLVPTLEFLDRVDSTNSYMAQRQWDPFSVVLSLDQTHGRGRLDRSWVALPGDSLALSICVPVSDLGGESTFPPSWVPLVAGACLVEALRSMGVNSVTMKWPNDVLVYGKKISGVLCELRTSGDMIVGIGLNLRFSQGPPAVEAISLEEVKSSSPFSADRFVAGVVSRVRQLVFADHADVREFVQEKLATLGRDVSIHPLGADPWRGKAEGLDGQGNLIVRKGHGEIVTVSASDIRHLRQ